MSNDKLIQPVQAGPLLPGCLWCLEFSKGQSGIKASARLMESLRMLLRGFFLPVMTTLFLVLQLSQILSKNTLKIFDIFTQKNSDRKWFVYFWKIPFTGNVCTSPLIRARHLVPFRGDQPTHNTSVCSERATVLLVPSRAGVQRPSANRSSLAIPQTSRQSWEKHRDPAAAGPCPRGLQRPRNRLPRCSETAET